MTSVWGLFNFFSSLFLSFTTCERRSLSRGETLPVYESDNGLHDRRMACKVRKWSLLFSLFCLTWWIPCCLYHSYVLLEWPYSPVMIIRLGAATAFYTRGGTQWLWRNYSYNLLSPIPGATEPLRYELEVVTGLFSWITSIITIVEYSSGRLAPVLDLSWQW